MQRIAVIDKGINKLTVKYQLSDHLGSSCVELNENTDIISYEEYHPFGTTSYQKSNTSISQKRYRYNGKECDNETGLYYYGARYYAAWICRFVSTDPLKEKYLEWSPYVYCADSPIKFIDPDGKAFTDSAKKWVTNLRVEVAGKVDANNKEITELMTIFDEKVDKKSEKSLQKKKWKAFEKITKLKEENKLLNEVKRETVKLERSKCVYDVKEFENNQSTTAGKLTYDNESGNVVLTIFSSSTNKLATFAHELKHAFQFEIGNTSLAYDGNGGGSLHDITDEVEAFTRGQLFGANTNAKIDATWVTKQGDYDKLPKEERNLNTPKVNYVFPIDKTYYDALKRDTETYKAAERNPKEIYNNFIHEK